MTGQERAALEKAASEVIEAYDGWSVMSYPVDGSSRHHAEAWFAEHGRVERAVEDLTAALDARENTKRPDGRKRFLLVRTDDRVLVCDAEDWGSIGMPVGHQVEAVAVSEPEPTMQEQGR